MNSGKSKLRGFRLTPIALAVAAMGFAVSPMVFAAPPPAPTTPPTLGAQTNQKVQGTFSQDNSPNPSVEHSNIKGNALQNASGALSSNVAAGNSNAQDNATTVVSAKLKKGVQISAQSTQSQGNSTLTTPVSVDTAAAAISGNAFSGSSGTISANNAAGSANEQSNDSAIADAANDQNVSVVSEANQTSQASTVTLNGSSAPKSLNNNGNAAAAVTGNAFQGASGNVGANDAAGGFNQQTNTMAVANGAHNVTNDGAFANQTLNGATNSVLTTSSTSPTSVSAKLDGNAFQNAQGNLQVNVTAGADNQQANSASIVKGSGSLKEGAAVHQTQVRSSAVAGQPSGVPSSVTGVIDGNAFKGASGSMNVNVSSGANNQQANATAISDHAKTASGRIYANVRQIQTTNPAQQQPYNKTGTQTSATISGHAFQNASGNIGVNEAVGASNQQANATSTIAHLQTAATLGTSHVSQSFSGIRGSTPNTDGINVGHETAASLGGFVFKDASGNVDANVSAGVSNAQANVTTILASNELAGQVTGEASAQTVSALGQSTNDEASLADNAFAGAHGAVGVNISAGAGNLQANTLTIIGK